VQRKCPPGPGGGRSGVAEGSSQRGSRAECPRLELMVLWTWWCPLPDQSESLGRRRAESVQRLPPPVLGPADWAVGRGCCAAGEPVCWSCWL
jgi:hypothetical protein